jgi:hypothetical protein
VGAARILVLTSCVVALLACGGSTAPSGPAADAAKVAAKQQVSDLPFETFVSDLKLDPATADQIRASRAAVNAQVKPIKLTSFAARQGVRVEPAGIFMVLMYATFFADSLDPMTGGRNAGGQTKPDPLQSTTSGGDTTTTTFLNITMNLQGAGSKVTMTMQWTYKETTTNTKTGEKIVEITDDRTMVGSIDVCPSDGGVVPATLDVHIQLGKSGSGVVASRTSTSSNTFTGHVDDQAVLRRVTHDMQQTASWQNSGGAGGYDFNSTGLNWNAGESGISGGVDASGIGGSAKSSGSATDSQVTTEAGGTMAIDKAAVDPAYGAAQKLWRAGRCVVIQAPDYQAETPLSTTDQGKTQHDEEVDVDSVTKFGVNLKHRFAGGALSQPVKASLSGDKKLQPTELKSGSGSLSYTAPGEDDKQATVTLKSVSKRGIGNLVIAFHTKGKHLKLSARGTLSTNLSQFNIAWTVTMNPADFHKVGTDNWEAQTTAKLSGHYTNLPINCAIQFTETANVTLVATRETRADQPVWVVRVDPLRSSAHLVGAPCVGGSAAVEIATGGYALMALNAVGDIVIPGDGGTVTLSGTKTFGPVTSRSTLTFTGTVTEE